MSRSNIAKHTICLIKILFLRNNLHLRISTCMYIYSSNQIPLIYYRLAVHVDKARGVNLLRPLLLDVDENRDGCWVKLDSIVNISKSKHEPQDTIAAVRTNNLKKEINGHKNGTKSMFGAEYNVCELFIHFEIHFYLLQKTRGQHGCSTWECIKWYRENTLCS